ncbi:MAG: hypothetical protein RBU45_08555 [Myxococcota bacterium]|jgi:hypothetical protein|nr:hypothetical protein [Myxococcota bacterium]
MMLGLQQADPSLVPPGPALPRRAAWAGWRGLLVGLLVAGLLGPGRVLQAGPLRLYGYGTAAMALGNADAALGSSYAVLDSNPALLTAIPPGLELGSLFAYTSVSARLLPKPPGTDVPLSYYSSDVGVASTTHMTDRPLPTIELPVRRHDNEIAQLDEYLILSLGDDFGVPRLRVGLLLALPLSGMADIHSHYDDELAQFNSNTVHFTRFGEWDRVFTGFGGAAYDLTDWLSLGLALQVATQTVVDMRTYVPDSRVSSTVIADTRMQIESGLRPVAGLALRPGAGLHLGLTWRSALKVQSDAKTRMALWNYHESADDEESGLARLKVSETAVPMVFNFEPLEVGLALGGEFSRLRVQALVSWQRWSRFLDHHGRTPAEAAAFDPVNPGDLPIDSSDFAFSDVFAFNGGLSYNYWRDWVVHLGGAYQPSPVPAQVGATSFADSDLLLLALGHRLGLRLAGLPLQLELAVQLWRLVDKTVHKDPALVRDEFPDGARTILELQPMPESEGLQTNNPGFPGYLLTGWEVVTGLSLRYAP